MCTLKSKFTVKCYKICNVLRWYHGSCECVDVAILVRSVTSAQDAPSMKMSDVSFSERDALWLCQGTICGEVKIIHGNQ